MKQEPRDCVCLISYAPFKRNVIYKFCVEIVSYNNLTKITYMVTDEDNDYCFSEKVFYYLFDDKSYLRDKKIVDLVF